MPFLQGPPELTNDLAAYINGDIKAVRKVTPDYTIYEDNSELDLLARLKNLEAQLVEKDAEIRWKDAAIRAKDQHIKRLGALQEEKDAEIQRLQEELHTSHILHTSETKSANQEADAAKQEAIQSLGALQSTIDELCEKDRTIHTLQTINNEQEKEISSLKILNTQLLMENDEIRVDQEVIRKSYGEAEKRCHSLKATIDAIYEIDMEGRAMQREIRELRAALDESEDELDALRPELQTLKAAMETLKADRDTLKADRDSLKADRAIMSKALMEAWGEKECGKAAGSTKQRYKYKYERKAVAS